MVSSAPLNYQTPPSNNQSESSVCILYYIMGQSFDLVLHWKRLVREARVEGLTHVWSYTDQKTKQINLARLQPLRIYN